MHRTMARALVLLMLWLGGVAHAGTVTYVYTDPQGAPLAEADANGNITATFDYAPYGSQALGTAPSGPGYTGHVNDPDTGLVYMQARYYDPVGRMLSVDPVGPTPGNIYSFNRYGYASNNPIMNIDPDGRQACAAGQSGQDAPCNPAPSTSETNPPPPPPPPSPTNAKALPPVTVTANSQQISAVPPPIFKIPDGRPLFRKSLTKTVTKKIDDFLSKQIVKKASFKTLTISKEGFLEPTPLTFGIYIIFHSPDLGGCDSSGRCADEVPVPPANGPKN